MIHSGQPVRDFIDSATRHVLLRQGVLGIKVKIMRGSDPEGKSGPSKSLPDSVTIIEPKEEQSVVQPMSQDYGAKAAAAQAAAEAQRATEQQGEEPAAEEARASCEEQPLAAHLFPQWSGVLGDVIEIGYGKWRGGHGYLGR